MKPIEFVSAENPVCSIVVLAWRLEEQLLECLRSVAASEEAPSFELVIVLNGASEATRRTVREGVTGARIVDIPENVGFGGGCNAGASGSTAEYLVFLNDDTLVDPLWLKELYATAAADASVGAVASLLLNADGTVQEAGSRVLTNNATLQFGHGLSRGKAAAAGYLDAREIDYGSAAALLVRADAFRAAAGFDPAYEPAYFEDVDLQFRLKSAGLKVVFQPLARVVHLSGASTSGSVAFRTWASHHSAPTFRQRWASVLEAPPAPDAALSVLAEVPVAPDLVSGGRSLASASEIIAGASETALAISRGYALWVTDRLNEVEAENAELEPLRAEKVLRDAELEAARETIETLTARVDELTYRLHDLDHRGPVGIARWQAALLLERRRNR